jgi:hypothetical protein
MKIISYSGNDGPITSEVSDTEIHLQVSASGTDHNSAKIVLCPIVKTVVIVTASEGNTGVSFFSTFGVGSVIEMYTIGGPVTVYASSFAAPGAVFFDGNTSIVVDNAASFKSVIGGLACLSNR